MKTLQIILTAIFLVSTALITHSAQYHRTFNGLVDESELIFAGIASEITCRPGAQGKMIFTDVIFDEIEIIYDEHAIKRQTPKPITLSFAGGTFGGKSVRVSDVPEFTEGERYLLMVKYEDMVVPSPVVGSYQGAFVLIEDSVQGTWYPLTIGRRGITGFDRENEIKMTPPVEKIEKAVAFYKASSEDTDNDIPLPVRCGKSTRATSRVRRSTVMERKNEKLMTLSEFISEIQSRLRGEGR